MPCDPVLVNYTTGGKDRIVTPQGTVVAGTIVDNAGKADGTGYISHFATCQRRGLFKK